LAAHLYSYFSKKVNVFFDFLKPNFYFILETTKTANTVKRNSEILSKIEENINFFRKI